MIVPSVDVVDLGSWSGATGQVDLTEPVVSDQHLASPRLPIFRESRSPVG
ncbi:hypothetical protein N806_31270 [Rhodococcus sp. P27]|nr:hypothetical protein N806_31270 [Rhodococcus sp. P27]